MNDHDVRRILTTAVSRVPEGRSTPRTDISRRVRKRQAGLAGFVIVGIAAIAIGVVVFDTRLRGESVVQFTDQHAEPTAPRSAGAPPAAEPAVHDVTLRGRLPDGTPYRVVGPGAAELVPVGLGVTLLVEQTDGLGVLGTVNSTRWRPDQLEEPLRRRAPQWHENRLVIVEPPWQLDIVVYDQKLSRQDRVRIASAIKARLHENYLVLSVDRPLRFAREAEGFRSALSVEYDNGMSVIDGCHSQSTPRVICSPDESLSLALSTGVTTSDWSILSGE